MRPHISLVSTVHTYTQLTDVVRRVKERVVLRDFFIADLEEARIK